MLNYIILGITQGLTEFLPVSSSAHLIIMHKLLNLSGNEVAISVILHLGTALSLLIFFFKDIVIALKNLKYLSLIIIVTVITGIIGISGKDFFEGLFSSLKITAIALIFSGIIIILTKRFMDAKRNNLSLRDAVILGFTQGLAIIPGISRSGITISTLLFRRVDKQTSFRFSFLASIPAVFGATLLEARKIISIAGIEFNHLVAGFTASLLSGIFALWILKLVLKKAKFYYFGYYCIIVAIITLLFIK